MRRILRKVASGKFDELGDITTLSEPEIVEFIIKKHSELVAEVNEKWSVKVHFLAAEIIYVRKHLFHHCFTNWKKKIVTFTYLKIIIGNYNRK